MVLATKTDFYRQDPARVFTLDLTGFSMYGGLMLPAIAAAGMAALLVKRQVSDGVASPAGVCWFSALRLLNHQLRVPDEALVVPAWSYPALYWSLIVAAVAAIVHPTARHFTLAFHPVRPS